MEFALVELFVALDLLCEARDAVLFSESCEFCMALKHRQSSLLERVMNPESRRLVALVAEAMEDREHRRPKTI